jgi:hypothetical protein
MLKKITLFLAFLCSVTAMAQSNNPKSSIPGTKLSKEILDQLKATTTVFFYSKLQESQIDSIKQAVGEGWKITPLIFDDISNSNKYTSDPKYSYFIITKYTSESRSGSGSYSNTHYFLSLRLFKEKTKKGNINTIGFFRTELYPNYQTLFGKNEAENMYNKGAFFNWSPILLKAQLEVISSNLENSLEPDHYGEFKEKDLAKILSTDTLYVPASLLMSFNPLTANEKEKEDNVFKDYAFKYRICTDSELFDIFQTSKRGRFLFEYVKSSTDKFITIYDLQQKKVIYRDYVGLSYNLKSKDIKRIK